MRWLSLVILVFLTFWGCTNTTSPPPQKASFVRPVSGDVFSSGDVVGIEWESINMPRIGIVVKRVAGGEPGTVTSFCKAGATRGETQNGEKHYHGWLALHLLKHDYPPETAYEIRIVRPEWECGYHSTGTYDMVRFFVF